MRQPRAAFTRVDFTTDWNKIMGANYSAGIWIRNALNTAYVVKTGSQVALGYASTYFGDPRTFGGHVRCRVTICLSLYK